jgi:hypothetical protein
LVTAGIPEAIILMLRIEKRFDRGLTTLRLSGRIQAEQLQELQSQVDSCTGMLGLDLEEVTLLDRDVVHFLVLCESKGMEVVNCPLYIQEWMFREKIRKDGFRDDR